jgi:hypothetical protein
MTVAEMSSKTGLHFRSVAQLFAEGCRAGLIDKVGAIHYELLARSQARRLAQARCRMLLDDLFDWVRRCEEVWPCTEREAL